MTSEIRANTLKNRVGLGTVSFTNTGPVVSGIVTATSIEVVGELNTDTARIKIPDGMNGAPFTGNLEFGNNRDFVVLHDSHHNYIKANTGNVYVTCGGNTLTTLLASGTVLLNKDLDVDGHTNLDNVSIAGVATATTFVGNLTGNVTGNISGGTVAGSTGTFSGDISITDKIVHTDDTNTAIRFPAVDTIQFETAGDARLHITNNGRVGINTTVPSTNLDVVGNSSISGGFTVGATLGVTGTCNLGQTVILTGTNPRLQLVDTNHNSDYSIYGSNGRFTIYDDTNSAERFKMESNGYVNIGTGTAQQQLTVQNSAQHSIIRVISKNTHDAGIDFGDTDDTDIAGVRYSNSDNSLSLNGNAVTRLKIDSGGRVMIGGGSSPSQVGDGRLIVYSTDRLHPAIKPAGMINNYANGWTLLGDNYQSDESQVNLGVSYSSSGLVLSRGVKVSGSQDDVYLSSQDSYATRPCAIKMDYLGAFNFLTTETNATVATDSAVSLTEVFKIDRVGNIYQKISGRNMYFGASNQLRIGVQSNGDSNIEAVSGDLKIMDGGSVITQVRSDGLENFQHVYPSADNSKDLGKSGRRWANIYTTDLHLSNEGKSNVVDGTWGDWTLQEGEHKIYMINNRTGKKYSLKMEEE